VSELTLKFSENYEKLPIIWEDTEALLIGVTEPLDIEQLRINYPAFIEYDTKIRNSDKYYPLPEKGEYIVLSFIHMCSGKPFTTIRRFQPFKLAYYQRNILQKFKLIKTK
jgi:hypothetical protein